MPAGWVVGPPDYLIIGAQRCGTTWWHRSMAHHEGIAQIHGPRSELHVFDRFDRTWMSDEDVASYHALFARPPGKLIGEKTPDYLNCFWVPEMLRQAAPGARLIVLTRDPVERYRSGIDNVYRRLDQLGEPADFVEREMIAADQFGRGLYARQIAGLLDVFPRDQLLVLQYERCLIDMPGQLRRTFEFLGLPSDPLPTGPRAPTEKSAVAAERLGPERTAALVRRYREDVARLPALVPDLDPDLWPNFREPADAPGGASRRPGDATA